MQSTPLRFFWHLLRPNWSFIRGTVSPWIMFENRQIVLSDLLCCFILAGRLEWKMFKKEKTQPIWYIWHKLLFWLGWLVRNENRDIFLRRPKNGWYQRHLVNFDYNNLNFLSFNKKKNNESIHSKEFINIYAAIQKATAIFFYMLTKTKLKDFSSSQHFSLETSQTYSNNVI